MTDQFGEKSKSFGSFQYQKKGAVKVSPTNISDSSLEGRPFAPTKYKSPSILRRFFLGAKPERQETVGIGKVAEPDGSHLAQTSSTHKRALIDERLPQNVIWRDTVGGHLLGFSDKKGAIMWNVMVEEDPTGPMGYKTFGLFDSDMIHRVKQVSQEWRSNGLPTEVITNVSKVEEVYNPISDEKMTVQEWKDLSLEIYKSDPHYPQVVEYLANREYFIVSRDMAIGYRLADLAPHKVKTMKGLKEVLGSVFRWTNTATDILKSGIVPGTKKPDHFDVEKNEDIERFITTYLPDQMGTFAGRMAKLGYTHGYCTQLNWTLAGTLIDLDSVKGLNTDEKRTERGFAQDFGETIDGLGLTLTPLSLASPGLSGLDVLDSSRITEIIDTAKVNFTVAYLQEKYPGIKDSPDDLRTGLLNRFFDSYFTREHMEITSIKKDHIKKAVVEHFTGTKKSGASL